MTKDYYKILGITEFESAENIKTAYRKLARKWHPDIAGSSKDVLSKFKDINEAYEILSNKVKKEEYDRARNFYNYAKNNKQDYNFTQKNTTKSEQSFSSMWEEFLSRKKRENSFKQDKNKQPLRGDDIYSDIEISTYDVINGTVKVINMLQTQICPKCKGKKFVNGTTCPHCNGKGEISEYKKFKLNIPKGIKNNSKIRLAGEGNKGKNGGQNGDLFFTVHILEEKSYRTDGLNILKSINITPSEAVLGTSIKISTLNGNVIVKINPRTQNGQKIRLSGCGLLQKDKRMVKKVKLKLITRILI